MATPDLPAGRAWDNPMSIRVPTTAYAPQTLMAVVGWYRLANGERMVLPNGDTTFSLGQIELRPRQSASHVPNPLSVNFENQVELVGYSMSTLSPRAGDDMEVTLFWRRLREIDEDYVVFVHVLDMDTLVKYGSSDAMPAAWTRPTSTWQPGEIIEDTHVFTIDPGTPADIFEVEIGVYTYDDAQTFPRLRIVPETGGLAQNYLLLSSVNIQPNEEGE